MKVAILTSSNQWFIKYSQELKIKIPHASLYFNHEDMCVSYDIVFILSYHRIIEKKYLDKNKHNIVIHASELPKGKGWAPMFWQILEGKSKIIFSMFEASLGVDDGDIYMKDILNLTGYELNQELRYKQANLIIEMCLKFYISYNQYKVTSKQEGYESFYEKRTLKDSELDINKSIDTQFNLLRIVDNEDYPAFFEKDGKKYILKIEEAKDENR